MLLTCSDSEKFVWKISGVKSSADGQPSPKSLPPFDFSAGPTPRTKTPMAVFQLFITTVLLGSIVSQTKIFAARKGVDFDFCIEELQAFIHRYGVTSIAPSKGLLEY